MNDLLAHRGPDGAGVHVDGAIGLAHRRLAVLDTSPAGAQPMQAFGLWITYNGEIYNFRDLRRELEGYGHRFRTGTDTEVILAAYRQWGEECVARLCGMFAFAIWDPSSRTLFAARDRLGKKPFWYRLDRDGIAWASEPKAFLAEPGFDVEPDRTALACFLALLYVPGSHSAFQGLERLPPAHILTIRDGRMTVARYWRPSYQDKTTASERDARAELRARLETAVARRLVSDVPLGAFLSGGIDSATVVALMARAGSGTVRTFSIGFAEDRYNELPFARQVAGRYGTRHEEFVVRPNAVELLPALVWQYGEPYADSSAVPTFCLSQLTRRFVTVALTGDGGDEIFAGYDRYRALEIADRFDRMPAVVTAALAAVAAGLPRGARWPWLARVARFLEGAPGPRARRYARWMTHVDRDRSLRLYTGDFRAAAARADPERYYEACFSRSDARDPLDVVLDVDLHTYLPDDLLVKVDIASMAHGLEARSPLLDHELVEFAARLPARFKLRGRRSKHLLRSVAEPLLPPAILHRPKQGFGVPLDMWFRTDLRTFVADVLTSRRARERGYFVPDEVARILDEHASGRRNHHHLLWGLVVFELWHQMFVDRRPSGPADAPRLALDGASP